MKPQYKITDEILASIKSISENLGEINANFLYDTTATTKKEIRKKSIYFHLKSESNSLTEEQLSALLEDQDVDADKLEIQEALNLLKIYKFIDTFKYHNENDFLHAHSILMKNFIKRPGKYRNKDLIVVNDTQIEYSAPEYELIPGLMKDLFKFLKDKTELSLIKLCVFHYQMNNIYPFMKGNAKIRRFWQNLIVQKDYPIFEIISFEDLIYKDKNEYYKILISCRESGKITRFIEYILNIIDIEFSRLIQQPLNKLNKEDRISQFLKRSGNEFTRKNYLIFFPDLSPATASRDLKFAVDNNIIKKKGDKMTTIYFK